MAHGSVVALGAQPRVLPAGGHTSPAITTPGRARSASRRGLRSSPSGVTPPVTGRDRATCSTGGDLRRRGAASQAPKRWDKRRRLGARPAGTGRLRRRASPGRIAESRGPARCACRSATRRSSLPPLLPSPRAGERARRRRPRRRPWRLASGSRRPGRSYWLRATTTQAIPPLDQFPIPAVATITADGTYVTVGPQDAMYPGPAPAQPASAPDHRRRPRADPRRGAAPRAPRRPDRLHRRRRRPGRRHRPARADRRRAAGSR